MFFAFLAGHSFFSPVRIAPPFFFLPTKPVVFGGDIEPSEWRLLLTSLYFFS